MDMPGWMKWLGLVSILLYNLGESRPLRLEDYERSAKAMAPMTKLMEDSWTTTCTSEAPLPADVADDLGCLSGGSLAKLIGSEISSLVASDSNLSSVNQIINDIVTPLESVVGAIAAAAGLLPSDNVCFGNWQASDLDFDGCDNIPLQQDSSFTVLSMSVTMPITEICEEEGEATFCIAVSLCPDTNLPTVAVDVGGVTLACIAEKLEVVTAGVTTIATEAAEYGVDSIGFGLSIGQQFATDLDIYTALDSSDAKLMTYNLQGMYYEQVVLDIVPTHWFGGKDLPDLVSFGGAAIQTLAVSGLSSDSINDVFSSFKGKHGSNGNVASDIGSSFLTLVEDVSLQFGIKIDLSMSINFSTMNNTLGKILPDTDDFELAKADAFLQTATTNTEVNESEVALPGGLYVFAGIGAIASVISGLVEYVLQFTQSIINLGGDWLPFELSSASDLIDKIMDSIDASTSSPGNQFGFGFAVTEENVGLLLNLPLVFADLGYLQIECTFTWADAELHCSVRTDLNRHFFKAIAELTEQGVLWLARETDETFDKVGNIIAAGLEDATSAASVWGEENVRETISKIKSGAIDVEDDLKAELDNWATWGDTVYGSLADEVSEITTDAIHTASKYGQELTTDAEEAWNSAKRAFSDAAAELEKNFGCGEDSIISTLGGCSHCCRGLDRTEKWLSNAGNDVEKALESVWKDVTNVADDVAGLFYSHSSSYSHESYDPKRYDGTYDCQELKVYEKEKEKVMGIVVDSKTKFVGTTLDGDCLHSRLTETQTAQEKYKTMNTAQQAYEEAAKENANAIHGALLTSSELLDAGFTCDPPELIRDTSEAGQVRVTVTCSSLPIDSSGSFSGDTVRASRTLKIDVSELGNTAAAAVVALQKAVGDALASKITSGFNAQS